MKLRSDLLLRCVSNEYIIVDPSQEMIDMSKVYMLNDTAAFIWKELDGSSFTLDTIVQLLLENYEVAENVALEDAKQLIDNFDSQGLIVHD